MNQNYEKLKALLTELFQLDQPDLDFGLYRIMHAKSAEVSQFLDKDLFPQVNAAFSLYKSADKAEIEKELNKVIAGVEAAGMSPEQSPKVQALREQLQNDAVDTGTLESEVYDHLFSFFRRYYSEGDFLAKRVYKPGVYAIPYEGEEVMLHWANKDQYYIKTSEYLRDYAFRLHPNTEQNPMRVHFRLADAAEGEPGNVKVAEGKERRFRLAEENTLSLEDGELIIRFTYHPDTAKQKELNSATEETILAAGETELAEWITELRKLNVRSDGSSSGTRLRLHLDRYTARNTFDYFIHKDLGTFLRRELDFFIKNEVMHLDDVENETVSRVEQYLSKIKVIRKIGGQIIDFLAQLEEFQKKLWLKKKFVVETNYCITLDRVPEELYPEVAANKEQCKEWIKLFSIDEIQASAGDLIEVGTPGFSWPLTIEFLKANDKLVLDTRFFDEIFKARLIASIENFDKQCDGLLIHSENFQALSMFACANNHQIKCIYIDPPYNTGQDEFLYKDSYQSSSWLCMLSDRLSLGRSFLRRDGAIAVSIDENEVSALLRIMDDIFGKENRAGIASVKRGSVTGHKAINKGLVNITEYLVIYAMNKSQWNPQRAFKARERNDRYNNFIINLNDPPEQWKICSLLDAFADFKGIQKTKLKKTLGKTFEDEIYSFVKARSESVIQLAYPDESNVSKDAQEAIKVSRKNNSQILHFKRDGVPDMYLIGGQRLLFYKDRLVEIDGEIVTAEPLSDIWDDILPNDLHNEGGVSLKKGKKPEKLLNRIYDICCENKEIVCDFFLGSGTTSATALKRGLKFLVVEQSEYFDSKALMRLKLVNKTRKAHETEKSFITKYIRLESYEDTLNNLELKRTNQQQLTLDSPEAQGAESFREHYLLHYMLDVETRGSQSLLNVQSFTDPTAYRLKVKRPGSDESGEVNIDLLETFNWLIGLTVQHIAAPQSFSATFERDSEKRLRLNGRLRQEEGAPFWFRTVTGITPDGKKTLIIWRKLSGEPEQDNLVLDEWFRKHTYSTRDAVFDLIYVNGGNNLPNVRRDDETWKVRLIEEDFHRLMFEKREGV